MVSLGFSKPSLEAVVVSARKLGTHNKVHSGVNFFQFMFWSQKTCCKKINLPKVFP
jgi:hypothetical protein